MINKETILVTQLLPCVYFSDNILRINFVNLQNILENTGYIIDWKNYEDILKKRLASEVENNNYPADKRTRLIIVEGLIKLAEQLHVPPKILMASREEQLALRESPRSLDDMLPADKAALEKFIDKVNKNKGVKRVKSKF